MTGTMRVAICTGPNQIEIQKRPIPSVDRDKVLIKVILCGICSTDLAVWHGVPLKKYPYSPGHEFCGIVEQTGTDVKGFQAGRRVVVNPNLGCGKCTYCTSGRPNLCDFLKSRPIKSNGGLSEYAALDYRMLHRLEALPDELAPFVEPLSCAIHAVNRARAKPDKQQAHPERYPPAAESPVIFGAGTMGILTGLVLKSRGCEMIFIEPDDERRRQARELFAADSMTPEQFEASELAGKADVAIDCSGNMAAVSQAIRTLRKGGHFVLAGLAKTAEVKLPLMDLTTKELEVAGSWLNPGAFEEAIRTAVDYAEALKALSRETFPLSDIASAFERAASSKVYKVLIKP